MWEEEYTEHMARKTKKGGDEKEQEERAAGDVMGTKIYIYIYILEFIYTAQRNSWRAGAWGG